MTPKMFKTSSSVETLAAGAKGMRDALLVEWSFPADKKGASNDVLLQFRRTAPVPRLMTTFSDAAEPLAWTGSSVKVSALV